MGKWIDFIEQPSKGVTKIFKVISKEGGDDLGIIKWYTSWRCYTFQPEPNTIFETDCLTDINTFLKNLMDNRKKIKQANEMKITKFEDFKIDENIKKTDDVLSTYWDDNVLTNRQQIALEAGLSKDDANKKSDELSDDKKKKLLNYFSDENFNEEVNPIISNKGKYPELDKLVQRLADEFSEKINEEVQNIKSKMPYKAQYVLEEVIKDLQSRV